MTQALYAHMNNKKIFLIFSPIKENGGYSSHRRASIY
jgi:hypothetical protein